MSKDKIKIVLNIIFFLIFICFIMLNYGIGDFLSGNSEGIRNLCILVTFSYIAILISAYILKIKLYSISIIYISFFNIFIFAQIICKYLLGYIDPELFDLSKYVPLYMLEKSLLLSIYCMISMYFGTLINRLLVKKRENHTIINENIQEKAIRTTGFIVFILSAPISILELINKFSLAIIQGYKGVYSDVSFGVDSVNSKIIPFFYISLLLILFSYRKKIKIARIWLILIIAYSSLKIFLGSRGMPILEIVGVLIMWHTTIEKISTKKIFVLALSIIPLATLISLIREMRGYGLNEWMGNFGTIFIESFKNNPILSAVNEMGTAIYPTAVTLMLIPEQIPYKLGQTFFYAIFTMIPNLGNGIHWARDLSNVNIEISENVGIAFGGSIVQEFYANFGWYCIIFFAIFMFFLSLMENRVCCSDSKWLIKYPLYYAFFINVLWTVRNNSTPLFIYVAWYIIPVYILSRIIYSKYKKAERSDIK